jgi:3-oxoacyl-[acyl-carrier-protein] synthase-1
MRIAVVGLGIVSAIGRGADEVLTSLRSRRMGCEKVTGIEPVTGLSHTAQLGIMAAGDALADAITNDELRIADCKFPRTALVSGTSTGGMDLTERFFRDFATDDSRGRLRDVVGHECADSTRRIANALGITGFTTTISTACSSAANAIILGAGLIRQGLADRVVAGGTDALCNFTVGGFRSLGILDPAPCRPFDRSRAGLNLGEGAGYVVLQRDDTLVRKPYGYLTGWANANDAFHQTAYSHNGEGAYLAMSQALERAGLNPGDIDYINAHGTGTPNNDASEAAALVRVFGSKVPPFSSTKPFTGHTLAAAGGIEAVISLLAIGHGVIFPNCGFSTPMDETPLVPQTALREGVDIKHVMSNSFGFGGNNATLIFSAP